MARQVPSRTDAAVERSDDPEILYLDDDRSVDVIAALSSDVGFATFRRLNERPLTASELAAELDVTVQNAGYHLENLQAANLVDVVDTCYSEKGREMDIYAATSDPTVLVLAAESERSHVRQAFAKMAGAVGVGGVVLVLWRQVAGALEEFLEA